MFDHMYGVMRPFDMEDTPWKKDLWFAVKVNCQRLFKHYEALTPMTGLSCISTQFLDPFPQVAMIPEMGAGN
jgi:hypothetical protein